MNLRRWNAWSRWALLIGLLTIAVIGCCTGCASAPRSVAQLEAMDDAQFDAWIGEASDVAEDVGTVLALEFPDDVDNALAVCDEIDHLAAGFVSPKLIREAIARTHWKSQHAAAVLLIAARRLERRGGLPGGERGKSALAAISAGVREGLASVPAEEERPSK